MANRIIILLALLSLYSCDTSFQSQKNQGVFEHLDPLAFFNQYKAEPSSILIDLRHPDEVSDSALWGSVNKHYFDPGFDEFVKSLKKGGSVMLYCSDGSVSQRVAKLLSLRGHKKIYVLSGGYQAWKKAGY